MHYFADEQQYISFIWNVAERTVCLPEEKFIERKQQIDEFLVPRASFNLKQAEKLIGRLVHTTYIVPNTRCYMPSLHCWEAQWKVASARRTVPGDVGEDLLEWQTALTSFQPRRIIPDTVPIDVKWVGDASLSGIGILIDEKWAEFRLVKGWNSIVTDRGKRNIAWAETVAIRLSLLGLSMLINVQGNSFIVLTDNTTSQAAVDKHKSGDQAVNKEWKQVQKLLVKLQCDILAKRVATGDNLADLLTRGLDSRDVKDRVVSVIPDDLRFVIEQCL